MKRLVLLVSIFSIATLIHGCSNPESPVDQHLKKLWELPIEGSILSSFTVTDQWLIFKTSGRNTGKLYKVSKDGDSVQTASTGGCTIGTARLHSGVLYSNSCSSIYALRDSDLSTIWNKSTFASIPILAVDDNFVYVTDLNVLSALDKTDASVIWSTPIVGKNSANPVIVGDTIYFATNQLFADGYLYAVNKTDGTIAYRITIPYLRVTPRREVPMRVLRFGTTEFLYRVQTGCFIASIKPMVN
jgi:outer membrane protein assembly factor BamB